MEKGLEITFNVPDEDGREITEVLASLVGNEFLHEMDIDWRIFNVKLDNERFSKVCFTGSKISKLRPFEEKKVREKFEDLSYMNKKDLLTLYREKEKKWALYEGAHP